MVIMEIRPIHTSADYQAVLNQIEQLLEAEPDTPDSDRLEVLTTLVEAYEDKHYPIPEPDPVEAIRYYMESRGLKKRDLQPYLGDRQRVNDVLSRKRRLSIHMIRNLHSGLGISADVLIQPYALRN